MFYMKSEMSDRYKSLINRLLYVFFIVTLLFPVIIINKIMFLAIMGLMFVNYETYRFKTIAPFLVFLIFLWGFIYSFFHNADRAISQQFFLSTLVLFLIYPVNKYKIELDKIVMISGIVMAVYTWLSFLIVLSGVSFSGIYYDFFFYYSTGSYSLRDFTEEGVVSFQMGTLPFLYLPIALCYISFLKERKYSKLFMLLILFATLVLGGSRGSILTAIVALVLITFVNFSNKNKIRFLLVSIPVLIFVGASLLANTTVFDKDELSNAAKLGHVNSFWKNLNFFNFFLGEGLASYYFSEGAGGLKSYTEITPLDMLRYFGFILTPIMYTLIIFPIKSIRSYLGDNFIYFIVFFMYLLNSMTNPTMFNSYGLLVVLWYWSKILSTPKGKNEAALIRLDPV